MAVAEVARGIGTGAKELSEKMNRRALAMRVETYARRATETARALADAREALNDAEREVKGERERANAATAACQALRRELGRMQKLNLEAERRGRYELERGAKARKTLVEMVQDAKKDSREARGAAKEASERAQMMEEWAKRRDAAATNAATRLNRSLQDCASLARRIKVVTEENVRLRKRAVRDRAELDDATEYSERLESDWMTREGEKITARNPIYVDSGTFGEQSEADS
ncbi:unnamed product [Ostreococcus tauri]|uniref:Unnamed product n=1 Tax=Ostreococcus tauri TaxID=70448 RepID=A0A090LYC8_OSTTA|nr:unnamed product [Ostreococcus tauri]CEF96791.1 unnamed product [Ostreococcus tauri]|eukprot:XP_022838297.1 unnamed product [Ostreococcus tauri]